MTQLDTHKNDDQLLVHHFPAQAKALGETRAKVRATLSQCGCSTDMTEKVVIAIDEACQNIIRHAYGQETEEEIILHIQHQGDSLAITLRDCAPPVDPNCMRPRKLEDIRPGGLGCHFIEQVMEEVSVELGPKGKGNILRMVKRLS